MGRGVIYGLCDPSTGEVRYVGKTSRDPSERLRGHLTDARLGQTHLHRWLRSVSCEPSLVILEHDPEDLNVTEREWIARLRAGGTQLCNLTDGGDGFSPGWKPSAHTRAKQGAPHRGKTKSRAHREKISASLTGRKRGTPSAETRAKIGVAIRAGGFKHKSGCTCKFCLNHRPRNGEVI